MAGLQYGRQGAEMVGLGYICRAILREITEQERNDGSGIAYIYAAGNGREYLLFTRLRCAEGDTAVACNGACCGGTQAVLPID